MQFGEKRATKVFNNAEGVEQMLCSTPSALLKTSLIFPPIASGAIPVEPFQGYSRDNKGDGTTHLSNRRSSFSTNGVGITYLNNAKCM